MTPRRQLPLLLLPLLLLAAAAGCRSVPQTPSPGTPLPPPLPRPATNAPPARTAPPARRTDLPPPPPLRPAATETQIYAIQLHLDDANFAPGAIDGHWGPKTEKAFRAWQLSRRLPPTGTIEDALATPELAATNDLFETHTVSRADLDALTPHVATWLEKSRRDRLGHTTLAEALAERYHLSRPALQRLNPTADWPDPPPGTPVKVLRLRAPRIPSPHHLEIRIAEKTLRVCDAEDRPLAQFPCSIAADREKHNVGATLEITRCANDPDYTYDPALFDDPESRASTRRLRIPPGPNNPVGTAWMGLSLSGYGIHGTPDPEAIGRTESHGCIRLANWDAQRLLRAVRTGLPVHILP